MIWANLAFGLFCLSVFGLWIVLLCIENMGDDWPGGDGVA